MDIREITKEIFEKNVPAAKMPERNTSVYERVKAKFDESFQSLINDVVNDSYVKFADEDNEFKDLILRTICLDAFVRTCRSLDLVLTATGFGIVSTESTAPASKVRVDALIEEMNLERIKAVDRIISKMIFIAGWADSEQAKKCIDTLFYSPLQLQRYTTLAFNTNNWQRAKGRAITADTLLRSEISEEYMEELLQKQRSASLENTDIIVVQKCCRFIGDYISQNDPPLPNKLMLQSIVEQMENYPQSYLTYTQSRLYRLRHGERYENKREDPTFFFM